MDVPLLNRELSRLDYNRRVLAKAEQGNVPLLERLRYLTYCSRNLDEFFMVRMGAVRDLIDSGVGERSPDGITPSDQMARMRERMRELLEQMYRCLNSEILPELRSRGVVVEGFRDMSPDEQAAMRRYFEAEIAPVLTPLAIDPGHPFPFVTNLALNIAAVVESTRGGAHVVLLKLPALLPHFVSVAGGKFIPMGSIIIANLQSFFPSLRVRHAVLFRVIRNSELAIDPDVVQDLRDSIEAELRRRERNQVVCLEIDGRVENDLLRVLTEGTKTQSEDVYPVPGFLKISDLQEICDRAADGSLRYPEFNPRLPQPLAASADIFSIIAGRDVLLHRPFDSFTAILEFLHSAASDPAVVAIKQTLYQTDEESPVVDKLILAALNGKQVTVIIELQTRFEEKRNIAWARRLTDAGVQVVYGLVGRETHAKLCLVVRQEGERLRQYVHLSTGNYNVDTARDYTDLDLLTANPAFGDDAAGLVNMLTAYSWQSLNDVFEGGRERPSWRHFVVAPFDYHRWLLGAIERERRHALDGRPARIAAKLNSLVDPQVIQALYAASSAGVPVDLVVRAICCLVPGLPGLSENIRVMSIVDRFLEHSRIIRFENGGAPEVFLSSGDWMPRNFQRRIELTFPLVEIAPQRMAMRILDLALQDTASSWQLRSDGTWDRRNGAERISSQERLIEIARSESLRLDAYEETVEQPARFRKRARRPRRG